MAALTPTKVATIDLGGGTYQMKIFTVTPQASGDTVDLSSYFTSIISAQADIIAGGDAALTVVYPAIDTTTVTLTELEQDGTVATDWTGASIKLVCIGTYNG